MRNGGAAKRARGRAPVGGAAAGSTRPPGCGLWRARLAGGNKVSCREPAALAGVPALASGAAVAAVALGTGTLGLVVSQAGGAAPGDASAAALYVMPVTRGEGAGAGLAIATARRWSLGPEEALGGVLLGERSHGESLSGARCRMQRGSGDVGGRSRLA